MQTPDIMSYANATEAENRRYASRWGYGFHVFDHAIDKTRVPHWSKLHVVQLYLPDYDYLLWIDADAAFFDQSRRIEEVMGVAAQPEKHMWAQDIWPDYPSIHRNELIDTGIVLFRNSHWTRQFLMELYHYPACQEHLNWTEQYCFTVAYNADLMGMRARMSILPTPVVNHHIIPPPDQPNGMFILHLAGRPSKARTKIFSEVHWGRPQVFRDGPEYEPFWNFHRLFGRHGYGGIASLQTCIFGMGAQHRAFLDALLFHFPYMGSFTIIRQGAPGLWTAMRATEEVGERYPDRMAHIDIQEYMVGQTREGEKFVEGFFCDIFVLGVESWRHLPSAEILGRLARSGLEAYSGEKNKGFGYSALRDAYFVWLYEGCGGGEGAVAAASGASPPKSTPEARLDPDDEDGSGLQAACTFLTEVRRFVESAAAIHSLAGDDVSGGGEASARSEEEEPASVPMLWSVDAPGERGVVASLGSTALVRVPRKAFPSSLLA